MKIAMHCPECGSDKVLRDAYAEWDKEEQKWVLLDVYDTFACNECGLEMREPEEIEINDGDQGAEEAPDHA